MSSCKIIVLELLLCEQSFSPVYIGCFILKCLRPINRPKYGELSHVTLHDVRCRRPMLTLEQSGVEQTAVMAVSEFTSCWYKYRPIAKHASSRVITH